MIINVPGFFVYICVVCLHEQMCLCVCLGTYIYARVHTCVCIWCGSLRLPPGVLPQLLFLLYIEGLPDLRLSILTSLPWGFLISTSPTETTGGTPCPPTFL